MSVQKTKTFSLIATSVNQDPAQSNLFSIKFPSNGITFGDADSIILNSINLVYSFPNITAANNNNSFSYKINGVSYPVLMPDGFYSSEDINSFLIQTQLANGHYIKDANDVNVFFITLKTNPTYYRLQFMLPPIPAQLPSGYTNPANVFYNSTTFANPTCIQVVIPNTRISEVFGMSPGIYPGTSNHQSLAVLYSDLCPQVSPIQSIIVLCNAVQNNLQLQGNALYTFSPSQTSYGSNIYYQNNSQYMLSLRRGSYQSIDFTLVDQQYRAIKLLDPNCIIQISININS